MATLKSLFCQVKKPNVSLYNDQIANYSLPLGQLGLPHLQAEHLQLLQQTDAWPQFERLAFDGGHEIVSEVLERLVERVLRG